MNDPQSRFVAVAFSRYASLSALPDAVSGAHALAKELRNRQGFEGEVVSDRSIDDFRREIEAHLGDDSCPRGTLIVSWSGHGRVGVAGSLRLLGKLDDRDVEFAKAEDLGEWCSRTGARQILILIDCCYAGAGLVDAFSMAEAVNRGRDSQASNWFGIVAASLANEPALSGAPVRELMRLLTEGPRDPDLRWDKTRPYIRGDVLIQTLVKDWGEPRQSPYPFIMGPEWDLVRNPLYVPGVPDQPVEHLLLAARGGSSDHSYFVGREQQLGRIVAWMKRGGPGIFVVTGPAGSGKSAIAGRIVSLSSRAERARILAAGTVPSELDPGEGAVDAQVHARGVTLDTASDVLARQLGIEEGLGAHGVLGVAHKRRKAGDPLVFVIDGLDEAQALSGELAVTLIAPLGKEALVLVTTRDVPDQGSTLVQLLGPAASTIDLGQEPSLTTEVVREYVVRRLEGLSDAMNPSLVADELASANRTTAEAPFLLARLVTSQLRERPADTSQDGWRLALATTVESALERDLQSVVLNVGGKAHPTAARELLWALTLARGSGFPVDDVWPAVATEISPSRTKYSPDDAYALMTVMGRHITAGTIGNQPVYRIEHQPLVDYLIRDAANRENYADGSIEERVGKIIFDLYSHLLDSGLRPRDHAYLWLYAWLHLAEAGPSGLERLGALADRDREAFLPDLAAGLEYSASQTWSRGDTARAIQLQTRATTIRHELGDPIRRASSLFSLAIFRLSAGDDEGAEEASREAAAIARDIDDREAGRQALAMALLARALTQFREGNYRTSRRLAEEVIALLGSGDPEADPEAWDAAASAYSVAGQAATLSLDFEAGEQLCRRAIQTIDGHADAANYWEQLSESLAALATVQVLHSATFQPDDQGRYPPVQDEAARRLLAEHRRRGAQHAIVDVTTGRGLTLLVRSWLIDQQRGLAELDRDEARTVLSEALELTRPHVENFPDAALAFGSILLTGCAVFPDGSWRDLKDDLANAQRLLRIFGAQSAGVSLSLGLLLYESVRPALVAAVNGEASDFEALIAQYQEILSLLRPGTGWAHRTTLGAALTDLSALLSIAQKPGADAARDEAISVWRELSPSLPEARQKLLALLIDQASQRLEESAAEALDLATEALKLATELPLTSPLILASAEIAVAVAQHQMGMTGSAGELLWRTITRLEPEIDKVFGRILLATACMNLAQVEMEAKRFPEALALAQRAVELFDVRSPLIPPIQRLRASITLGMAQRGTGDLAQGTATIRPAIDALIAGVLSGTMKIGLLAGILNAAAGDLWDEVVGQLADKRYIVRILRLARRRPRQEAALVVQAFLDELAAPEVPVRVIHALARQHQTVCAPEFADAWREAAGEIPPWLAVDVSFADRVSAWFATPTWELSRDYLSVHPFLLNAESDVILEELRDEVSADTLNRHLALLRAARAQGVEVAYAPLLAELAASRWTESENPQEYLDQHPDLLRPEITAILRAQAAEGDSVAATFGAIVELSQRGERPLAFLALESPASVVNHLAAAVRTTDFTRLAALATIVQYSEGTSEPLRRRALVAFAIAELLQKRAIDLKAIGDAVLQGSDEEERGELVSFVNEALASHPTAATELASLIVLLATDAPVLTEAPSEEGAAGA